MKALFDEQLKFRRLALHCKFH